MPAFIDRIDRDIAAIMPAIPLMDLSDIAKARAERADLARRNAAGRPRSPDIVRNDHRLGVAGRGDPLIVREYRPAAPAAAILPALLWAHGGGHVLGTIDQDDMMLETLVAEIGCAAFSVDWRRAPEHPYPAAIDDCYAALAWLFGQSAPLAIDPARIAIGGTSSGGGLAAGLGLLARDRGDYAPCFQWLFYPMLDDRGQTASSHAVTHASLWNRASNQTAWTAYLGGADPVPAYAAPARAIDLSGLPPTYLGTGALDLFVDENIDYAQRLIAAGISTELCVYPGAVHGFELFAPAAAVSRRFVRDRTDALRRAFGVPSSASSKELP